MTIKKGLEGHGCGIFMVPSWQLCAEMRPQKKKNIVRAASVPAELQSGGTLNALALHRPLSIRRGVLTVNTRESAVQITYVNLKVVDKLQVMENTKVSIANQIMSDIKLNIGNTHKEEEKQDGNNRLGEMLHSNMKEEHGKILRRRRRLGEIETGGGYSI
jgi:hypothetical protein